MAIYAAGRGTIMKRFTFLKNAAILTATALILRTMGIFFRIYMSNAIGAEGMGLYQLIFSVYVLAAAFAGGGISTAVTRLCADELACGSRRSVIRILHKALVLTAVISLISMALVFFSADFIAGVFLGDLRAAPALRILCPSLPFMGISSCLRGYFIARRKTGNPSAAQIFEQLIRIGVVMALLAAWAGKGVTMACAAVLLGDTVAEICSCGYMYLGYLRDKRRLPAHDERPDRPAYPVYKKILAIALPITGGRYLNTILRTVENLLIPGALSRYAGGRETGLSQFGMLKGMAMPILFFPSSFLSAMSTLLVPEISEAAARGQKQRVARTTSRSIHITLAASILIGGLFLLFAPAIGQVIYGSEEVGYLIRALAPIVPFMYLESVCDGILKGLNQQTSSFAYSIVDSLSRIGLILALVPFRGMQGFLAVMVFSNILTSSLNIRRLLMVTHLRLRLLQWIIKPLACVAAGGAGGYFLFIAMERAGLPLLASLPLALAVSSALYLLLMLLTGGIKKGDLQALRPSGRTPAPQNAG